MVARFSFVAAGLRWWTPSRYDHVCLYLVAFFALRKTRRQAKRQATEAFERYSTAAPQSACCAGIVCRSATSSTFLWLEW